MSSGHFSARWGRQTQAIGNRNSGCRAVKKACPFRGRWQPEGLTEEVALPILNSQLPKRIWRESALLKGFTAPRGEEEGWVSFFIGFPADNCIIGVIYE